MKYIIFDLESTCGIPDGRSEIIEIGAVKIDPISRRKLSEFQLFIKPQIYTTLTPFCTELTGITQVDVDNGVEFPKAMRYFLEWINVETPNDCVLASWGYYDKHAIISNYDLLGLPKTDIELWLSRHISLKHQFSDILKCERCGIVKALQTLELSFEGRQHRGIDDAINISKIFVKMFKDWRLPDGNT